jgi:hypothetical protein
MIICRGRYGTLPVRVAKFRLTSFSGPWGQSLELVHPGGQPAGAPCQVRPFGHDYKSV